MKMKHSIATLGCTILLPLILASGLIPASGQISHNMSSAGAAQGSAAANPTLQISVNGQKITLTSADFAALPHKTVVFHNVHTKADETYSGVPVTDLLTKYGAPSGDKLRGKGLSDYVVATGSDGYKSVLALAETDPSFHPGDVIVADSLDGKPLDAQTGPFRLVVTEDKRPARSVHNLVSIELRSAE